jgi:two-component system, cell cycle sensor histidine kinase and response regulator CckA
MGRVWGRASAVGEGQRPVGRAKLRLRRAPGTALKAARESEEKYRSVIENTAQSIAAVVDGAIVFANGRAAEVTGVPVDRLVGSRFRDLLHPDDRSLLDAELTAPVSTVADSHGHMCRVVDAAGRVHWMELTHAAVTWENRPALLVFMSDVTAHKRLEEDFFQGQKMEAIGRLAGGVAHDFNNYLTIIVGFIEALRAELDGNSPAMKHIDGMRKASLKTASLTRQLLAFGRKQRLLPRAVNLNDLVDDMGELITQALGPRVELIEGLSADLGPTWADAAQLEQVIMNLAVNARDAMPTGGQLLIETYNEEVAEEFVAGADTVRTGSYAVLAISDTGTGMDAEVKAHLFEPFFTTKEMGKGTGLGLATVYGIVRQSNGFVLVSSEMGTGTTFRIYLPRSSGER